MKFEWDEDKNEYNKYEHGVSFEEASTIFEDINILITDDFKHSTDNEERFIALGRSYKRNLLFVCYCIRVNDTIRLISARKNLSKEQKEIYYANCRI